MTARELIQKLQNLGEDNLDREVIIFDGPARFTPYKVEILSGSNWGNAKGKIIID